MSIFKVTLSTGKSASVNAAHVVAIHDNQDNGSVIHLSTGENLNVKETYRSVRGYVAKALAGSVKDKAEESAE